MNDPNAKPKIIGAHIHLETCEQGGLHVTGIDPITDASIVYDAPDADEILMSSSVGYNSHPAWNRNWEATFGERPEQPEPELN